MQESCIQGRQIRASNSLTLLPRCHLKSTKKIQGSSFNACSKRTKKRHFSCYLCSRIHNKPNNNPVEELIFKGIVMASTAAQGAGGHHRGNSGSSRGAPM